MVVTNTQLIAVRSPRAADSMFHAFTMEGVLQGIGDLWTLERMCLAPGYGWIAGYPPGSPTPKDGSILCDRLRDLDEDHDFAVYHSSTILKDLFRFSARGVETRTDYDLLKK